MEVRNERSPPLIDLLVPVPNQRRKTVPSIVFMSHSLTNGGGVGHSQQSPLLIDADDDESNGVEGSVDSIV
jgi:hypothetical protein